MCCNNMYFQTFLFLMLYFIKLDDIPLIRHKYQDKLNIIYDINHNNYFDVKTINKVHKRVTVKILQYYINNIIDWCRIKYKNNCLISSQKILNNNLIYYI